MDKQKEFLEEFKSQILQIPGLPLEKDTADTVDEFEAGERNLDSPRRSKLGGSNIINSMVPLSKLARDPGPNMESGRLLKSPLKNSKLTESKTFGGTDLQKLRSAIKFEKAQDEAFKKQMELSNLQDSTYGITGLDASALGPLLQDNHYHIFTVEQILSDLEEDDPIERKKLIRTLFQYRRGPCVLNPDLCKLYRPNERVSPYENPIESLRCVNCHKSMNSHLNLRFKISLTDQFLEYQTRVTFHDEMIKLTDYVILLAISPGEYSSGENSTLSIFYQQLASHGMKIKDVLKMSREEVETKLYRKHFVESCPLENKNIFEDQLLNPDIDGHQSKTRTREVAYFKPDITT
jgi:hypothetical protein